MGVLLRTVDGNRVALCAAENDRLPDDAYLDDADHGALCDKFLADGWTPCGDELRERVAELEEARADDSLLIGKQTATAAALMGERDRWCERSAALEKVVRLWISWHEADDAICDEDHVEHLAGLSREALAGTARVESALRDLGSEYTSPAGWDGRVREAVRAEKERCAGIARTYRDEVASDGMDEWAAAAGVILEQIEADAELTDKGRAALRGKEPITQTVPFGELQAPLTSRDDIRYKAPVDDR